VHQATGSDTHTLPAAPMRIAAWLKAKHPYHTAKLVAAETGAEVRTVEGWLQGRPPIWRHWQNLCGVYGVDFVCQVCLPDSDLQLRARVLREIEAAEARLVQTLAEMREGLA
jgi:hypothetical protein